MSQTFIPERGYPYFVDDRPDWDRYWLQIALDVASRGGCIRRKVGCVLVDDHNEILMTGYNGKHAGSPNCNTRRITGPATDDFPHACSGAFSPSGTNLEGCQALHAEQNALLRCRNIREIHTAYSTASPCSGCVKLFLPTGCQRIVFASVYPHPESERIWCESRPGRQWIHLPM